MEVRTRRLDEDGHGNGGRKQTDFTMQHSGLYCRTKTMGAASVLPEGYDAESFATEPEPLFDNNGKNGNGRDGRAYKRTRRRSSASKQRAAAEPSMTAAKRATKLERGANCAPFVGLSCIMSCYQ